MAQSSWPSPDNSRLITEAQYERVGLSYGPVAGLVGKTSDTALVYADSTGLQVKIRADRYALVRGYEWWSGTTEFTKTIAANASGSTRIDLVVLRLTRSSWNVTVEVVTGTPGSGSAPAPTQNTGSTGVWELPIATVTVANSASTIAAANVGFVGLYLAGDGGGYVAVNTAALAYVPHPFEGQTIRVIADAQEYRRTASGSWVAPFLFARKTGDEAVASSITPQDDDQLFLDLEANATYWIDTLLIHNNGTTGGADIKVDQTLPTGASAHGGGVGPDPATANLATVGLGEWGAYYNRSSTTPTQAFASHATSPGGLMSALTTIVVMGATAGRWRIRWAQNASSTGATYVRAGSSCRAWRVA